MMKAPDTEVMFSLACSSDIIIIEQDDKRLWHLFRLIW